MADLGSAWLSLGRAGGCLGCIGRRLGSEQRGLGAAGRRLGSGDCGLGATGRRLGSGQRGLGAVDGRLPADYVVRRGMVRGVPVRAADGRQRLCDEGRCSDQQKCGTAGTDRQYPQYMGGQSCDGPTRAYCGY